ncbi:unnamed protein product [Mytilus coruscus]|uniref:Uncharacterized protein n=1 Tax=Mytilus coruscus TaxID=42192 RepID=A0A6J8AT77_MYTCO|nr:unnamed protein product [Mytilus coruscus]
MILWDAVVITPVPQPHLSNLIEKEKEYNGISQRYANGDNKKHKLPCRKLVQDHEETTLYEAKKTPWIYDAFSKSDFLSSQSRGVVYSSFMGNAVNPSVQEAGKKNTAKLSELASPSDKKSKVKNYRGADDLETQCSNTITGVHCKAVEFNKFIAD